MPGRHSKLKETIKRAFGSPEDSVPLVKKPKKETAKKRRKLFAKDETRSNDEVHLTIRICPVMRALIDTPHFQRLRRLKQLGTTDLVYPCANHSRFEHSLGVAKLAERMCKRIKEEQPQLPCSSKDILCIKLAGMLHDIGHGPFSHVYEHFCIEAFPEHYEKLSPEDKKRYDGLPELTDELKQFGHEQVSLQMIDSMLEYLGLRIDLRPSNLDKPLMEVGEGGIDATTMKCFKSDEVLTSRDFVFIKELIWGKPIPSIERENGIKGFVGRSHWDQEWLYSIVCNSFSGLDVDKMDYFARDSRRCFSVGQVDEVIIENAVVAWGDCTKCKDGSGFCPICNGADDRPYRGRHLMICYPDKMIKAVAKFFNTRFDLHSIIYQHKTTVAASLMVCDMLCLADPYFRVSSQPFEEDKGPGKAKKGYTSLPVSRAMLDHNSYIRLTDSVVDLIEASSDENMRAAKILAERFNARKLYKCVAQVTIDQNNAAEVRLFHQSSEEIERGLLKLDGSHGSLRLESDDIVVSKIKMHHGMKHKNPVANIRCVSSTSWPSLFKEPRHLPIGDPVNLSEHRARMPEEQQQFELRIYCRDPQKSDLLRHVFEAWVSDALAEIEQTLDYPMEPVAVSQSETVEITPMKSSSQNDQRSESIDHMAPYNLDSMLD